MFIVKVDVTVQAPTDARVRRGRDARGVLQQDVPAGRRGDGRPDTTLHKLRQPCLRNYVSGECYLCSLYVLYFLCILLMTSFFTLC